MTSPVVIDGVGTSARQGFSPLESESRQKAGEGGVQEALPFERLRKEPEKRSTHPWKCYDPGRSDRVGALGAPV